MTCKKVPWVNRRFMMLMVILVFSYLSTYFCLVLLTAPNTFVDKYFDDSSQRHR